jgi:hypothetical protein
MYRVLEGLDAYFKSGQRDEVKGIKIERRRSKFGLVRANKQRYEYAARAQEERQRRRWGTAGRFRPGWPARRACPALSGGEGLL